MNRRKSSSSIAQPPTHNTSRRKSSAAIDQPSTPHTGRKKSSAANAQTIILDTDIPDTPAKICDKMIEILLEEKEDKDKELLSVLSHCKDFSLVITTIDKKIQMSTESTIQLKYFMLFLDILKEHFSQEDNDSDNQLNKELMLISNFTQPLSTSTLYDELKAIIDTILSKYSNMNSDTLYNLLSPTNGQYFPFIISINESRSRTKNDTTFLRAFKLSMEKFDPSSPTSVMALSILFQMTKLSSLSAEENQAFKKFGGAQKTREIIKQLVEGTTIQQMVSIRMIQGLTNFLDADEAFKHLIEVLKHVINILNRSDDSVRLDVARMIKDIPPNCDESIMTQEEQIKSILAPCCEHLVSFEGDYADALMQFTEDRKNYNKFNELIMAMFASYNTSYAALLFAFRYDLLTPNMIEAAFPNPPVPDNRILFSVAGVKFLIANNKLDSISFKRTLAQILSAVNTESFSKDEKLLAAAYDGIDALMPFFNIYYFEGCDAILSQMKKAQDYGCLSHLANGAKSISLEEINKNLARNAPQQLQQQSTDRNSPYIADPSNYSKFFCSHFLFLLDKTDFDDIFFQLLRVFSPSITEKPINYFSIIPENCKEQVKSYANSKLKSEPRYSVICAIVPRMKDKEIHSLVKIATTIQPFDPIFYERFFYFLSTVYLAQTLKELDDLSTGKKLSTSIFTGKKKKQERHLLVTTTLELIPKLISNNELTAEQQSQLYKIVASSLPKKPHKILKIADDAKKMNDVFVKLPLAKPPKELASRLLPLPIFVESMPILLKSLKVDSDLVETMVKTYLQSLKDDPKSFEKTKLIIRAILEAAKKPATTNLILGEASKNFSFVHQSKSDNNSENQAEKNDEMDLTFCKVCKNCMIESQNLDVGFTDTVPYILALAPLPLTENLELRTTAFETYHAFIGFEPQTPIADLVGIKLSPAQLKSEVIQLFSLVATKIEIEKCSQIIKAIYKMKDVSYPHAILLRSFLSSRSDYLANEETKNNLTKIIQNHKDFTKNGEIELEKGLMRLALADMAALVPIIMNVQQKSSYRNHILLMLLTSATHRELFLDQYHKLLVKCDMSSLDTMKYFAILPQIIDTEESADMTALTFGTMVAEIIMLIAYAYSNNGSKEFGKSNIKQATENISNCLEKLFTKTQLEKKPKYNVNVNDITSVSDTIKKIAKTVTKLEVEKIQVLHQRCNVMLQSPNQPVLLVAGILDIHLFADFIDYKNPEANDLNETLSHEIAQSFDVSNNLTRRYLASLMPLEKTGHFKEEDIKKIFIAMSSSLAEANEKERRKATEFYTIIITNEFIDKNAIVDQIENLGNVLKNSFSQLEPNLSMMKILSRFLEGRCDIADFTGEAPNIKTLFLIGASSSKDVEMGQMAWNDLNLLKGNSSTIAESIIHHFSADKLKEIVSSIMQKTADDTELLSSDWFDLVCDIIVSIVTGEAGVNRVGNQNQTQQNEDGNQNSEIDQFNKSALRYIMPSVSKVNSIHHKKAADILKIIWQ